METVKNEAVSVTSSSALAAATLSAHSVVTLSHVYVVGAGGIGCAVGYAHFQAGVAATFVDVDAKKVEWGRKHGVGVDRRHCHAARFLHFDEWRPEDGSLVLLCTKCYDNAEVLARLPAKVDLIPIQNGFDPALEKLGGAEGVASFISECTPAQTHTRITRAGKLHLGMRGGGSTDILATIAQLLRTTGLIRVEVVPDVLPYKYAKLMYNAAISPIAAATGLDNGGLLWSSKARRLFFDLLVENYTILHEAGVPLGKVGPFHPDTVFKILRRRSVANALAWAFYPTLRKTYCSMSGDLPRGRTEIDNYNLHLIGLAGDRPCTINRRVYSLVKRMERERVPPSLAVLDELMT